MQIILLSGGSGKRLWPLSNEVRSKQFIKILKNEEGEPESMVMRVYRQIMETIPGVQVTIATGRKQVSAIKNQLGDLVNICVEPDRRDTFPAIGLAAAFLRDVQGISLEEPVVICPVDPYVEQGYFHTLKKMGELAAGDIANLVLMGIEPTYPSEKYGYIIPEDGETVSGVRIFKEKPDLETAKRYLSQKALWNGGVFACKLGFLLDEIRKNTGLSSYAELLRDYSSLEKISFDYAVVEQEKDIRVIRYSGQWKDIGTWNTFVETMGGAALGRVILDGACEDTNVVNELNLPILCMGCKNMVIAASSDGILISDKGQSSYIKPYVDRIEQQVMYAEKSWGSFTVLDVQEESLTIRIVLLPGHGLHYHSHEHRDEVWTVMSGSGRVVLDGEERQVGPGDVISMPAGCKHTVFADTELKISEVQLGKDITVEDKVKYDMD